jgi:hypothetical protein
MDWVDGIMSKMYREAATDETPDRELSLHHLVDATPFLRHSCSVFLIYALKFLFDSHSR